VKRIGRYVCAYLQGFGAESRQILTLATYRDFIVNCHRCTHSLQERLPSTHRFLTSPPLDYTDFPDFAEIAGDMEPVIQCFTRSHGVLMRVVSATLT
jgi:hypothetical protein